MTWRRRQGNAKRRVEPAVGAGEMEPAVEVGGWSMTTGAAANRAAVVRLAAWAVIISGPLLGGLGIVAAHGSARAVAPAVAGQASPVPDGTGEAGFAELFVAAYLSAGQGDEPGLAAMWPGARQQQFDGAPGGRQVTQIAAVRAIAVAGGVWSVTVGARVIEPDAQPASTASGDGGGQPALRYFQVPIASTGARAAGPWAYSALSAPAEVAAPALAQAPELAYGPLQPASPGDARARTVQQFLTAYLAGAADEGLDRYLSPGTVMQPVTPAPYTAVEVEEIAAVGPGASSASAAGSVPGDGTRQQVMVTVRATGRDSDRIALAYAFTLTARAGRWEITSLDPAPLPAARTPTVPYSPAPSAPPGATPRPTASAH